ncbi:MAG: iron ABC transporter permease [Roseobacter sp. MedPE-SWde]|uniref:ABC transporter permease n=1 Tax=Roseobacter sp. MED193 TaxID=314262 RepID=UPI000068E079|nr:iron chelate uptake ABC transporter family permease subunit [Roseobacter sp. MED193]EAQ45585.1 putative ironIII transport permease protein [Roseobacter sp. MED193]OIQ39256.1 MAG: iron ABC transporter permease [Roseobacter sp. MedPE-SWde]
MPRLWLLTCLGLIIALSVVSIFVGVIALSPLDLFQDPEALQLLAVSRLPRTAAAVLTGCSMAVSGQIMQILVRNKFVEPISAGTGQAAALGILLSVLLFPAAGLAIKMSLAAATALLGTMGFLALVQRLPPTEPLLVPLVGLVYGGILGAVMVFIAYQADLLQYVDVWMLGEFSGVMRGRYELLWIAGIAALVSYLIADQFAILGLGRDMSLSLGLNHRQVMALGLLCVSVVSALTVVTVGMLPFIGLVVPNLISRRLGDNLRVTLPVTALLGGVFVLACDILARVIRHPYEVPVGTVFGVLGTLAFLWLIYARPRHA